MSKFKTHNEATYCPQYYKSFEGALEAFFEQECPQLGGLRTRQVLVQVIADMVHQFFPSTDHLNAGQTTWTTVHKDAKCAYGKRISQTPLQPVILDLVRPQDILDRANGKKLRELKMEAAARLCIQAYEQQGCLTLAEVAILLKIAPSTASKYIRQWELDHHEVVPRRGTIHDMGPTLTHKNIIIHKLFIEQKTVQQVVRETYHSMQAIHRYIMAFRRVLLCYQKKMGIERIAFATGMSKRLAKEYIAIIEHYQDHGCVLQQLLDLPASIENNIEQFVRDFEHHQTMN